MNIFRRIFNYFYYMTPKGKKARMRGMASDFMMEENTIDTITKIQVIDTAAKVLKKKKIITFHKGKSITKPKASNHEAKSIATGRHAKQLKDRGLRVNAKNEFVNA